ncbi:MAG: nucleotidyltransferase substrate binding protein [Candidatus Yanofskyibacterium parasiticum]|nr:MAG: nucleotidyltransferase substrate binding protein [Candidatus Yanofskybacteria bacterium]
MANQAQTPRWRQRLKDFEKSAKRLKEAASKKEFSDLEKDGVIQRFEFTFELAWKTLKDYLENQGFSGIASPKKALQKSFSMDLASDGNVWINMLEDRNRMSHPYSRAASEKIFQNIKKYYVPAIDELAANLKKQI